MSKTKKSVRSNASARRMRKPWPRLGQIAFVIAAALMLFFLFYGTTPTIDNFTTGYIGVYMQTNADGAFVLIPAPDAGASTAGVEQGDILLAIDGIPLADEVEDPTELLAGHVGDPVTITVLKADGREATYTIPRSQEYAEQLTSVGLTADGMARYFVIVSGILGLLFAVLGTVVLFRRPTDWMFVAAGFVLLLFPYSLGATSMAAKGADLAGISWLYSIIRTIGLYLSAYLLLVYPTGKEEPDWVNWIVVLMIIWTVPYCIALEVEEFIPAIWMNGIWVAFFLVGLILLFVRYRNFADDERQAARPAIGATLALMVLLLAAYLLNLFLPDDIFTGGQWAWYYMIAEAVVDAARLALGVTLVLALRKLE
ncbi:MAG: PDZ domain-containing protein [Anaerolineales bacterium]|nr:PDZ domain-containing protein [Anaerolineales bacterium]